MFLPALLRCIRAGTLLILTALAAFSQPSSPCAACHREIAAKQSHTNMALTWRGATAGLPRIFDRKKTEGDVQYRLRRAGEQLLWRVQLPGRPPLDTPVEVAIGGPRHGVSFLARVKEIEGRKLERAALVETRFLQGAHAPN